MDSDSYSEEIKPEFEEIYIKEETEKHEPKSSNLDKRLLIQDIILNEQKRLKLPIVSSKKLTELNQNIVSQKRKRLIAEELLKESKRTFRSHEFDMLNLPSTSATVDHPVKSQVPFTSIRRDKLSKFLKFLSEKEKLNVSQKELNKCVASMNSSQQGHFTLPINILRAIKDCILKRNWNNLTHLLLILVRMPSYRYKHLIRHVSIYLC